MKVILSIRPEFVEKIITGEKRYEYRKKIFKQNVKSVIIYSTKPVGMLIGEFTIKSVLHDEVDKIWSKTNLLSGISHKFFKDYFSSQDMAFALEINNLTIYEEPIEPKEIIADFTAPQSFCYLRENILLR